MDKLTNALVELALDTENAEKNYNLGILYEEIGQTASAINYFYRAAERSKNKELIYECLCKTAICYERQGNRDHTVRRVLQHALYVRPKRPEAYYLISRLLERTGQHVDGYTYTNIALQICDFDAAPLRSYVEYPGIHGLLFEKAVCGWHWGKNDEARALFIELRENYFNEMDDSHKSAVENNIRNSFSKENKPPVNTTKQKKKVILDYFAYFDDTCKELLELRVKLLKDYIDYFIICESNKTHSGLPVEYRLKERIKEYGLPEEKIVVVELNIPEELVPLEIDYHNAGENRGNINSVKARTRERMQKDALMNALDKFDDDAIIIHSDCDEIIDPSSIDFVTGMAANMVREVIKVPLVYLEGRADLRVYNKDTNTPEKWDRSMFVCTKKQLKTTTPTNIRCNYNNPFNIVWCTHNGKIAEDMGWHFSWMGGKQKRKVKRDAFCHYQDNYDFLETKSYNSEEAVKLLEEEPKEGSIAPSLESNSVLKRYDISILPKLVFELENVNKFLFP